MKWFKHYTDASNDDGINALEQKFGYTGYGVYWKIIEICALKWDGITPPIFVLNKMKLRTTLKVHYERLQSILRLIDECSLFAVEIDELTFKFEIPNLLKIKDNHTKNLPVTCQLLASNLPLDKIRTDKIRKEKKASPATALATQGAIISDEWIVLEYFNATLKRSLKQTNSNCVQIKARLKEGYTVDQMKILIDHVNAVWTIDPFWVKQIKPATIFSGKFDGYLQDALNKPRSKGESMEEFFREAGCIA